MPSQENWSQDPSFPADNLTKNISTTKWLSELGNKSGRLEGVFQLSRSCLISHIDIGAYMALTVEVLVGRSSWPQNEPYRPLISACTFITPADCKQASNKRNVKMFNKGDFMSDTRDEPWDRIKVICTQPLRKDVQFGLCFVKVISEEETNKTHGASQNGSLEAKVRGGNSAAGLIKNSFYGSSNSQGCPSAKWSRSGQMLYAATSSTPKHKLSTPTRLSTDTQESKTKTFEEEVVSFLKKQDIQIEDLNSFTLSELRHKMEKCKGHKFSTDERSTFSEVANDFIAQHLDSLNSQADTKKKHEPDLNGIVPLDNEISLYEEDEDKTFKGKLHPGLECNKKQNKVEIYRNADFDLHATVNGSPIKILGVRNNMIPPNSSAKKKFTNFRKTSLSSSPSTKSDTTSERDSFTLSSPSDIRNKTDKTDLGQTYAKELSSSVPHTPPTKKFNKTLIFKKRTPQSDQSAASERTPPSKPRALEFTPDKSGSKRKYMPDIDEEEHDTNGVWLNAETPPARQGDGRNKKIPRLSDIVPMPSSSMEEVSSEDTQTQQHDEEFPQCPICMGHFPASELEAHGAQCARFAFGDGTSRIPDTPPCGSGSTKETVTLSNPENDELETMVECPICTKLFGESRISAHANMCADSTIS